MSLIEICSLLAAIAGIVAVYYAGVHLGSNFITERKLRKFKITLAKENEAKMNEILSKMVNMLIQQNKGQKSEDSPLDRIRQIDLDNNLGTAKVGFSAEHRVEQNEK